MRTAVCDSKRKEDNGVVGRTACNTDHETRVLWLISGLLSGEDSSYCSVQGMGWRPWLQCPRDTVETLARSCVAGPKVVMLFLTRWNLSPL